MILPGMGAISEIIACFSRKRVFGYSFVAFSSMAIAVLGFMVWGHHMFTSGQSAYASLVFSVLTMLVAVPSAVKVFNWMATLYKGEIHLTTPMLYAMGFIGLFTIGGLTGLFLGIMAIDLHVHDTYFVVAHFHYVMVGGMVMAFLGGIHFWWPKMFGRMYPEFWGRFAAITIFVGFNLTFLPQFVLGFMGMPRRYHYYPEEWAELNILSSGGASLMGAGYLMIFVYMLWSVKFGLKIGANPWKATGLEWQIQSPPTTHNFEQIPVVTEEAYAYGQASQQHGKEAPVVR
jgi:cytochrome c oxidase subunit 1